MAWAPDYVTVAELKAWRKVEDDEDAVEMALAITAASRAVDRCCNRQFGSTAAQDRFYTAYWCTSLCRWCIDVDDIMTAVGLTIGYDADDSGNYTNDVEDFRLTPVNAAAEGKPWTRVVVSPSSPNGVGDRADAVEVHAAFGWSAVPAEVKQATLLQASRFLLRRDAVFGVMGEPGLATRLLDRVDPDVALILRGVRKVWGAV